MNNSRLILQTVIDDKRVPYDMSESEYFELFSCEQILKPYDLSIDEINSGVIDGGDDGKVDAIYCFVNDILVQEDSSFEGSGKNPQVVLYIIQSKISDTYRENIIDGFSQIADNFLSDLEGDVSLFSKIYRKEFIDKILLFRTTYLSLAARFPSLEIKFYYVSQGDTTSIHPKLKSKADLLKNKVETSLYRSRCSFTYLGARELLDAADKVKDSIIPLITRSFAECGFSDDLSGYACFVNLKDFYVFISDENKNRRTEIFESNVRDYQGKVEVNKEINATLENGKTEDFWWLNNGVTIIAEDAFIASSKIHITNPQIVNGLQTSTEIFDYFKKNGDMSENRSVLVRVIKVNDDAARDKIIHATNSQTQIPQVSLRATEPIHRDIERYFLSHTLFYDRRKNYYKNKGERIENIIGIAQLAQSFMAIVLQRPNDSRARPSTLLSKDVDYLQIFSPTIPMEAYLTCTKLYKSSEKFLKSQGESISDIGITNIRFFYMLVVVCLHKNKSIITTNDLTTDAFKTLSDETKLTALNMVSSCFQDAKTTTSDSFDKIAKSKDFVSTIIKKIQEHVLI